MVWRRSGDKPLSEPMMVSLPTHICVTRPQWVKYSCIIVTTVHLQLYNSVFSKTMLMVTGWILLHFYDCSNIITLWPIYAPVKCIAITCENGLTPNRCQAIVVIKCADVCIKAPQKTVCWKFSHNCGTLNVPRFYDVTTILVEREMYWRYAMLLMLMTGLWSRNVKTEFRFWQKQWMYIVAWEWCWKCAIVDSRYIAVELKRVVEHKTKAIPTLTKPIKNSHISIVWASYGIIPWRNVTARCRECTIFRTHEP